MVVMVSEDMHERTGEQEEIGNGSENVARVRSQQVDASRCGHKANRQTEPRLEEVAKRVHGDTQRSYLQRLQLTARDRIVVELGQPSENSTFSPRAASPDRNNAGFAICSGIQAPGSSNSRSIKSFANSTVAKAAASA
jgi:hypothetical protein